MSVFVFVFKRNLGGESGVGGGRGKGGGKSGGREGRRRREREGVLQRKVECRTKPEISSRRLM